MLDPVRTKRIENRPELTGFRAIAAAMVFWGHMLQGRVDAPWSALDYGWTGVNLFFALSGFLFTRLYMGEILDGTFSYGQYMLKRLLRIYPLTILIVVVSVLGLRVVNTWDVIAHLTLVHGWFPACRFTINAPMWTLTVEEAFYALAPFMILLCGGIAMVFKKLTSVKIVVGLLALWLLSVALSRGLLAYHQDTVFHYLHVWDSGAWLTFWGKASDFIAGMLAALATMLIPNMKKGQYWFVLTLGVICFTCAATFLELQGGPVLAGSHKLGTFMIALLGGGGALVILGIQGKHIVNTWLSSRFMVFLGNISFALYLIQFMPMPFGVKNLSRDIQQQLEHMGMSPVIACTINYIIISIISAGVYLLYEKPVTSFLRKFILRRKPST